MVLNNQEDYMTKYSLLLQVTIFLSSLIGFTSVAEARDGCPVGQHPNPKNISNVWIMELLG